VAILLDLYWVNFMMSQGRHRKYNHGIIYFKHRKSVTNKRGKLYKNVCCNRYMLLLLKEVIIYNMYYTTH